MRKSSLLCLLFLLFFNTSWLKASETYIFSYRAQIKNAVVISESFHLTKTMQEVHAKKAQSFEIDTLNETDLHNVFDKNRDHVLDFFMRHGTHTRSHEKVNNNRSSSLITLTIPPSYITVDFKNDYAIITRLITD